MRDFHKGVWQMSLAMLISGSIGAFVLLSGLPVTLREPVQKPLQDLAREAETAMLQLRSKQE